MEKTNYTIAVMIYNVEQCLSMCLDSIVQQDGDDIEILLIDDGSKDSSGKICDQYAQKDSRIRVIHQINKGVAAARNVAIDNAKGRWLIQVDGDDILLENAVNFAREYLQDDADVLQFDAVEFVDQVTTDSWQPKGDEMIVSGDLLKEYHLQLIDRSNPAVRFPIYNLNPAWSKVWNLDFIRRNNLKYDQRVVKGEGTLFTFTASYNMKKVRIIPKPIYGYRINPNSIMHRFSPDILDNQNMQMQSYCEVLRNHCEENDDRVQNAIKKRSLYLIDNAISLGISHPDCKWDRFQKIKWLEALCNYLWVQEAVSYAKEQNQLTERWGFILNRNVERLVFSCSVLRLREIIVGRIAGVWIGNLIVRVYRSLQHHSN